MVDEALEDEEYADDAEHAELAEGNGAEQDGEEAASGTPEPEPEPEYYIEEIEVGDHRVAQLRKLRIQGVALGDATLPSNTLEMEDSGPSLVVCPNCNSEEVRGQKFCSNCNARLPNLPLIERKYNPGSIDGAARKYHDAITRFQTEEWSLDEFVAFLTEGLEKVRSHIEHLADLSSDGVLTNWLPEASNMLSTATKTWHDSVEGMLLKIDDVQVEHDEEEADLEELEGEDLEEAQKGFLPLEERVRMLDFTAELEAIFRSNDEMLEYLAILDANLKTEASVGGMQF
jgi:hypothetical protein